MGRIMSSGLLPDSALEARHCSWWCQAGRLPSEPQSPHQWHVTFRGLPGFKESMPRPGPLFIPSKCGLLLCLLSWLFLCLCTCFTKIAPRCPVIFLSQICFCHNWYRFVVTLKGSNGSFGWCTIISMLSLVRHEVMSLVHSSKLSLCLQPCEFAQLSSQTCFLEVCFVFLYKFQKKPWPTIPRERWERWEQVQGMPRDCGHQLQLSCSRGVELICHLRWY